MGNTCTKTKYVYEIYNDINNETTGTVYRSVVSFDDNDRFKVVDLFLFWH